MEGLEGLQSYVDYKKVCICNLSSFHHERSMMMELGGIAGVFYTCCQWFVRFAYVNLLWMFLTVVGVVLFGLAPATVALFTVMRHWIKGEEAVPVFRTFWDTYKKEFVKANGIGFILLGVGYLLYIYLIYLQSLTGLGYQFLYFASLSSLLLYIITLFYAFPVFVHYELKVKDVLMQALVIGISYPLHTLVMVVGSMIAYIIVEFLAFQFFFMASTICFVIMLCAYRVFTRMEIRQEQIQEERSIFS
jgi:uncharacterized membrane protein YesL